MPLSIKSITQTDKKSIGFYPGNGAVAVGGTAGGNNSRVLIGAGGQQETAAPSYVQHSDLQGRSLAKSTALVTFLVDGMKLKALLQPKHAYFQGKGGSVASFGAYEDKDEGKRLIYPKVKAKHRENPYRRMQLRRQSTGKTARAVLKFAEDSKLADFRVADLTLTMPKELSVWFSKQKDAKRARDYAWRMEGRFWEEMEAVGLWSPGSARSVNLHTWKTENPLQPHWHLHEAAFNYEVVADATIKAEAAGYACSLCGKDTWYRLPAGKGFQCASCYPEITPEIGSAVFHKLPWDTGAGGTGGVWTKDQLATAKAIWTLVVKRFARKHSIAIPYFQDPAALADIYVDFLRLDETRGKRKFLHKLNYKARHPIEDYAKYSNEHTDCPAPPDWLQHYDNKSRVFGYWNNLKAVSGKGEDKVKLSPYTAKPMTYLGNFKGDDGLDELLGRSPGNRLFQVDFVRGQPIETELSAADIRWLRSVCLEWWEDEDARKGYWVHKEQTGVDLQGTLPLETAPEDGDNDDILISN